MRALWHSSPQVEKVLELLIVKGGSNVAQKDSSGPWDAGTRFFGV